MDAGHWVIADLPKGVLGEQAFTVASLLFTVIRNAIFARSKHSLFTIYMDELPALVGRSTDLETVLSEARKFGVSVVTASQFLDQYPPSMRAAIQSVGTHIFFQLSTNDAPQVAQALDGGKSLAERLKNLPQRHFVLKTGSDHWREGVVPHVDDPKAKVSDLIARIQAAHARPRAEIEKEITERHAAIHHTTDEALNAWE
jgi:lysophospholipase L1-like esterase